MAASKEKKYYVVWQGKTPGIYETWAACKAQVDKYPAPRYKSFVNRAQAEQAFADGWQAYVRPSVQTLRRERETLAAGEKPEAAALAVDAACSGNPGKMEYRGVVVGTGQEIFHMGPFPEGTNNIGEFLAIAHGLALMKQRKCPWPLYSDSEIAIKWIAKKKCLTKLPPSEKNAGLMDLVHRAEQWVATNTYTTSIRKWQTKLWGEIPADFGRK